MKRVFYVKSKKNTITVHINDVSIGDFGDGEVIIFRDDSKKYFIKVFDDKMDLIVEIEFDSFKFVRHSKHFLHLCLVRDDEAKG